MGAEGGFSGRVCSMLEAMDLISSTAEKKKLMNDTSMNILTG
jgi:hypothetical protein